MLQVIRHRSLEANISKLRPWCRTLEFSLVAELSCSRQQSARHGVVVARLTTERPGIVLSVWSTFVASPWTMVLQPVYGKGHTRYFGLIRGPRVEK